MKNYYSCTCGHTMGAAERRHHGPTIGICSQSTGADWDTLLTLLTANTPNESCPGWHVTVFLADGTTPDGIIAYVDPDQFNLITFDDDDVEVETHRIQMADVLHFQLS